MAKSLILGCKAKDAVSNFTGIITSRHEHFNGVLQWGLQPQITAKKPGEHPDAISFDDNQLARIGDGQIARAAKPIISTLPFVLGDEVEDIASGCRGIAQVRSDFLNGCVFVSIQAKGEVGKDVLKRHGYPVQGIKRVGDGLNVPGAQPATVTKRPGGPPMKVERPY